ncbi:MAG: glycosyltransferase [Bacteroidales bacterium]|nr:glycosyltransferase [Bacteroidales bacterium]
MSIPKVSVIIPAYNTAPYLVEAVDSVLNQTLKNFEVIIVDDGSTDNTLEIIQNYAQKDSRIKYYHQKNQGQSVARNLAMSASRGEYIYFMDSDDILVRNALEYCYKTASENGLDLVTFDAESFSESGTYSVSGIKYIREGEIEERVYSGIDMAELMVRKELFRAAPWLLFVKRELLKKNNLTFYPGIIHEDELFSTLLFISAHRVSYIPEVLFYRSVRGGSTMTGNFSMRNINGYFTVIKELKKSLANTGSKSRRIIMSRI